MKRITILRLVPKDQIAVNYDETNETATPEDPWDLVMLEAKEDDQEEELDRQSYRTMEEAQKALFALMQGEKRQ